MGQWVMGIWLLLGALALAPSVRAASQDDCKQWLSRELAIRRERRHWHPEEKRLHANRVLPLNRFASPDEHPPGTKILPVPLVRQYSDSECGPAAAVAIAGAFGIHARCSHVAGKAKTDNDFGTEHTDLIRWAKKAGLEVEVKVRYRLMGRAPETGKGEAATIESVRAAIDDGRPVLVLLQAYFNAKDPDYTTVLEDGHYVAVVGYTPDSIVIMDPAVSGALVYVPEKEFLDRWHLLETDEDMQENLAIFFSHKGGLVHDPAATVPFVAGGARGSFFDFTKRSDVAHIAEGLDGYTGPAALQALLHRYGVDEFQADIAKAMRWGKASDRRGRADALAAYANKRGRPIKAAKLDVKAVEKLVDAGRPVMVRVSARWVIAFAFNESSVLLMDPKAPFNYSWISRADFARLSTREALWIDGDYKVAIDLFAADYLQ